jgi:hypothetical protein
MALAVDGGAAPNIENPFGFSMFPRDISSKKKMGAGPVFFLV